MDIFIASVKYSNDSASFSQVIGAFSSESKAIDAATDFIEGTLLIEYSDCSNVETDIEHVQLDSSIF